MRVPSPRTLRLSSFLLRSLTIAGCFFIALAVRAEAVTVFAENSDNELTLDNAIGDGGGTVGGATDSLRIGTSGSPASLNSVAAFAFNLPVLSEGETFDTASLSFFLQARELTISYNVDVYLLGARATSALVSGDYFVGGFGTDPTNATPLHDNFLVPSSATSTAFTSSGGVGTGATGLVAYLNQLYLDDPTASSKFLFVRLNPDADPPSGTLNRYRVTQTNQTMSLPGGTLEDFERPSLNFTTIPEPSSALLLAGGAFFAFCGRRRAQKE